MVLEGLGEQEPRRPALRIVRDEPSGGQEDPITRDCRIRRIRWMAKAFGLKWLVEQACFGKTGVEGLSHTELAQLHKDMEHAYSCAKEGISFEDAGLIRPNYQEAV